MSEIYKKRLFADAKFVTFKAGQTIFKGTSLSDRIYLIVKGKVRLLSNAYQTNEPITLDLRGKGQLVGWVSLLRSSPCEWITASEHTNAISLSSQDFVSAIKNSPKFAQFFYTLTNAQETYHVARLALESSAYLDAQYLDAFHNLINKSVCLCLP